MLAVPSPDDRTEEEDEIQHLALPRLFYLDSLLRTLSLRCRLAVH